VVVPHHAFKISSLRPQALQELFTVGMVLESRASSLANFTSPDAPNIHSCVTRSMETSRKSWSYYARLAFNLQDSHVKDSFDQLGPRRQGIRVKPSDSYSLEELMRFWLEPRN
jgi:hypothetical protein